MQLCPNGSPRLSEVPDGLYHSLSVDLSNTAWAQTGLINELTEMHLALLLGFDPENPRRSQTQDSALKTHDEAINRI